MSETAQPILRVENLRVRFPVRGGLLGRERGAIVAVDGVTFHVERGETLGLVGESGSGKSTVGRAILRFLDRHATGAIEFEGRDLLAIRGRALKDMRRHVQIVFQDPGGALNPRMRVWRIVSEPLLVHGLARCSRDLRERAVALLERCGMPASSADRFPHEFSGGQRQRIVIARALALNPSLLICDEPTSALDVSVQAQILNLLKDLQRELGLSYLFISHDMAVVAHMCDRIAVMQKGRLVEIGPRDAVLGTPSDDYTRRLLSAIPQPVPA